MWRLAQARRGEPAVRPQAETFTFKLAAATKVSRFMDRKADLEKIWGQTPDPDTATPGDEHPDQPHPAYKINIFRDWCKSCGICAAFCPRQCLSLDAEGAPVVDKADRCTGCRWCELHCPDFAICVREVEKAVEDAAKG